MSATVPPSRTRTVPSLQAILFQAGLWSAIIGLSGACYLGWCDPPEPDGRAIVRGWTGLVLGIAAGTGAFLLFAGKPSPLRRRWLLQTALTMTLVITSLVGVELVLRTTVVPWPARDLQGFQPAAANHVPRMELAQQPAAGTTESSAHGQLLPGSVDQSPTPAALSRNSWGQRDREHPIAPVSDQRRVVLIGDSFLDEIDGQPLSIRLEQKLSAQKYEVINLGVSATGPDEYHDRLVRVALPLRPDHCVFFIYAGNDFTGTPRTLETWHGWAAVSPRGSILSDLKLAAVNHLLTNHRRPVLEAWSSGEGLLTSEQKLFDQVRRLSDDEIAAWLLQQVAFPPHFQSQLAQHLRSPDLKRFAEMLRHPDRNRFRTYYLADGLWLAASGQPPQILADERAATYWMTRAAALCRAHHVDLTVVLIPEGFSVDPRMREQWQPLAPMQRLTELNRAAGWRMMSALRTQGVELIDLHVGLESVRGAYLNLDGHWSDLGTARVAELLAPILVRTKKHPSVKDRPAESPPTKQDSLPAMPKSAPNSP